MYETILLHTDIYKCAKARQIGHHTRNDRAYLHILDLEDLCKLKLLRFTAGIQSGLLQFIDDIPKRMLSRLCSNVFFYIDGVQLIRLPDELGHRNSHVHRHLLYHAIRFRMHSGAIQCMTSLFNAQETRCLFKCFFTQSRHFQQVFSRSESSVLIPIFHDVICDARINTTHITQQMFGSRIQVHTHHIHTTHHRLVQSFFQPELVHIMLILPYANTLRIDLHQFRQWVHQPSADTHRTPHRHILLRKFFTGGLRS